MDKDLYHEKQKRKHECQASPIIVVLSLPPEIFGTSESWLDFLDHEYC
jgi:hypothetical protein